MISRRRPPGISLAAALLLLALLPALLASPPALAEDRRAGGPGPGTMIRSVARPGEVREGQTFTVEIRARRLRDAGSAAFHLIYDPEMVEPVPSGFTEGPALRRGGASTSFLAAPASTGDRIMVGIARLGHPGGARGGGLLCKLTFRALKSGPATFAFDRARIAGPGAEPRPAEFRPGHVVIVPTRPGRKGIP